MRNLIINHDDARVLALSLAHEWEKIEISEESIAIAYTTTIVTIAVVHGDGWAKVTFTRFTVNQAA